MMILPTLLGRKPLRNDDRMQQNIDIARRRLSELDLESRTGEAVSNSEIEVALLDDLQGSIDADPTRRTEDRFDRPPSRQAHRNSWTVGIMLMLPVISIGLYLKLGNPTTLLPAPEITSTHVGVPAMLVQLEEKLADNPNDVNGWALAGRSYMHVGEFAKAKHAYEMLHQLVSDDSDVIVALVHASVMANDEVFSDKERAAIAAVIKKQPTHTGALWSAVWDAKLRSDYGEACAYLQQLLPLLTDNADSYANAQKLHESMQQQSQSEGDTRCLPNQ